MPYLEVEAFNQVIGYLSNGFSDICQRITLPEQSHEGRSIQGMRIGLPDDKVKPTVLLFGGTHARELVNPDLLLRFAADLLFSYRKNRDLEYGGAVYAAVSVRMLLSAIDIIIVPLINPDGREYVQTVDCWWRKNRSLNPGQSCRGVDLNRNYDFLWSSNIGSSSNACVETYKGSAPFSEPETRNIRWLLDQFAEIKAMVDVHSFSELVLYPWGDDENQTTDPNMNFRNPAFDGLRGLKGDNYREYMRPGDVFRYKDLGYRVRDSIYDVRGHCYTVIQTFLFDTNIFRSRNTGTAHDYAYSRHIVDPSKPKIFAYTLETGLEFQPIPAEAREVIKEGSAGLFEFCLAVCCPVMNGSVERPPLFQDCRPQVTAMTLLTDPALIETSAGQRYSKFLSEHFMEVRQQMEHNKSLYTAVVRLIRYTDRIAERHYGDYARPLDERLIGRMDRCLTQLSKSRGLSAAFKAAASAVRDDLPYFEGRSFVEGLKQASARSAY